MDSSMRSLLPVLVVAASPLANAQAVTSASNAGPITIHADRIVDGRGNIIPGGTIVVQNGKITRVDKSPTGTPTYDLKGMTLMPGMIDAHSHLTWYFNRQGRYHAGRNDCDEPVYSMLSTVVNAHATLLSGV